MKKNRMLRMASALLILTLLTTSVIGGTFAKYVSEGSVSDTARVAKWGVEIKTSGTLYSDAYAANSATTNKDLPAAWESSADSDSLTVISATQDDNIVAPGTKSDGTGLSFSLGGTPEVDVIVKAEITAEDVYLKAGTYAVLMKAEEINDLHSLREAMKNNENKIYKKTAAVASNPATYTLVTGTITTFDNAEYYILTNIAELTGDYYPVKYADFDSTDTYDKKATDIAKALVKIVNGGTEVAATTGTETDYGATYEATSANIPANTNLGTTTGILAFGSKEIKWKWEFESGAASATTANDPYDTILGYMIGARDATPAYEVVSFDSTNNSVTAFTYGTTNGNYTVKNGTDVVANLNTKLDITLKVEQVD